MARAKRTRVGPEWLAYWALQNEEDPAFVQEYLGLAQEFLAKYNTGAMLSAEMAAELAGLRMVLIYLEQAFRDDGETALLLKLGKRHGRPRRSIEAARKANLAACRVARMVEEGIKQDAALLEVTKQTGLSRSEILSWMAHHRRIRAIARGESK